MWKVYSNLNAFYIVKGNEIFRRNKAFVEIRPHTAKGTSYDFIDRTGLYKHLDLSEIVKEDGVTAYTQQEWNDFMDEFSGFNPASGGSEAITFYSADGALPVGGRKVQMGGDTINDFVSYRNNLDNVDLWKLNGLGTIIQRTLDNISGSVSFSNSFGTLFSYGASNGKGIMISKDGSSRFVVYHHGDNRYYQAGLVGKGTFALGLDALMGLIKPNEANTNTFYIKNGVAPTLSPTDCISQYSADVNGDGTAAPHFLTEQGDVIKLFKAIDNVFSFDITSPPLTGSGDFDNWFASTLIPLVDGLKKALRDKHGLVAEA